MIAGPIGQLTRFWCVHQAGFISVSKFTEESTFELSMLLYKML